MIEEILVEEDSLGITHGSFTKVDGHSTPEKRGVVPDGRSRVLFLTDKANKEKYRCCCSVSPKAEKRSVSVKRWKKRSSPTLSVLTNCKHVPPNKH